MKFKLVACGGTFEFLHAGHKAFLQFAFSIGEKVLIGLTTDEFLKHNEKATVSSSFTRRKQTLESFLKKESLLSRAVIVPIDDIYGPTISIEQKIDALAVTEDTYANAVKINKRRSELGFQQIPIATMPLLLSEKQVISSSAIRNGRIDEDGKPFIRLAYLSHDLILPQELREKLHKPFGTVLHNGEEQIKKMNPETVVTVGDVTTARFNRIGVQQKISVIDFVVERKKSYDSVIQLGFTRQELVIEIKNPAGMITSQTWNTIIRVTNKRDEKKRFIIAVEGEEDLLVIPLLLSLPLGFHIFYGQPHEGLVHVETTIENKKAMAASLKQFIPSTTRGY